MLAEGCTSHDGLLNFKSGMASNEKTVGWNERKKSVSETISYLIVAQIPNPDKKKWRSSMLKN